MHTIQLAPPNMPNTAHKISACSHPEASSRHRQIGLRVVLAGIGVLPLTTQKEALVQQTVAYFLTAVAHGPIQIIPASVPPCHAAPVPVRMAITLP